MFQTYFQNNLSANIMKHITILVPENASINGVEGPRLGFNEVNNYLLAKGDKPMFKVVFAGPKKSVKVNGGRYTITTDVLLNAIKKTDLIIIPALYGDLGAAVAANKKIIPWIIEQHKKGAEVASLCVGAFLLAATGLLKGKQCSTHWRATNDFRKFFPDVNLVVEKILTDEDGIYSSGGAYSSTNLILYLIEKYAGREIAIYCSKFFQLDIDRGCQSPFIMFNGQKEHDDESIKEIQSFIETNFAERIRVDRLAEMAALSRRNLERRFKKATANTVVEYIQRVKIEAAKKSLEGSRKSVNEVMYDVGYSDTKAFRTVFKKITGLSPVQYRNKYSNIITA
jgi:transcriptional regulator GlxA family with amidase domain